MSRAAAPDDPWADPRLRVALERSLEVGPTRLRLRDWPGRGGPLIHVPDQLMSTDDIICSVAGALAPRTRVLSLSPRGDGPYQHQQHAMDLLALLDQFGFGSPVLLGEGLGCLTALLVAAWFPTRVSGLILVNQTSEADVAALRQRLTCPLLALPAWDADASARLHDFLERLERH